MCCGTLVSCHRKRDVTLQYIAAGWVLTAAAIFVAAIMFLHAIPVDTSREPNWTDVAIGVHEWFRVMLVWPTPLVVKLFYIAVGTAYCMIEASIIWIPLTVYLWLSGNIK